MPDPLIDVSSLPAMDVAGRAPRLQARLADAGCDALVVTNLVNVRYLTGFTGSAGVLLVGSDSLMFVTDGRYRDQAEEQFLAARVDVEIGIGATNDAQRDLMQAAARSLGRIGLEAQHVSWARQQMFAGDWFPNAELVATNGVVEELRKLKDEGEVARIEAAAAIATQALDNVRGRLLDRPTEAEFGLELDTEMRRLGAADVSFTTIVGSGPNGAKPHARPTDRVIGDGDLVVLDFGALLDGYHSDMTRTVLVGEGTETQNRMLGVVAASQLAGVRAVKDGATAVAVDRACRAVIQEAGWGDAFIHGTGHGVGLDIHEDPRVTFSSDATLAAGHVVTVEPGVYLPDHGGVRIEDTVLVTADGCRPLTHAPKDPAWPSRPTI